MVAGCRSRYVTVLAITTHCDVDGVGIRHDALRWTALQRVGTTPSVSLQSPPVP